MKPKRRRTFRSRVRHTLAVLFGLYLGWSVAGVAFNELNASPAQPATDYVASSVQPGEGGDANNAGDADDANADDHKAFHLTPQEDTSWYGGVIAAAIGLFVLAIAAGLIFGENPPPPPAHHDDHGHDEHDHDEHGHDKAAH